MNERQLKDTFRHGGKFISWKSILDFVFGKVEYFSTPNNPFSEDKKVVAGKQFGRIKLDDGKFVALFEVEVNDSIDIENNRQGLREIAARHIDQNINHAALVLYYSPNQQSYRLTFIAKWSGFDEETGELQKGETQKKRYTYLLGGSQSGTTAAKRLLELANKKPVITIKDIINAFSVEALTKEFFKKYKEHYERFWRFIDAKPEYRILLLDKSEEKSEDEQKKPIRDFSKKLLGRIVFLHFLQKKGWMGCPVLPTQKENDDIWENGNPSFMLELFENFKGQEHFYSECLTELFFNTLNQPGRTNNVFSVTNTRVPYLNGGLFDNDQKNTEQFDFPSYYFQDLLEFFEQYNFTIDENSPDEQEVGIDPEMLGHIFENLLEENREKGAFYTPKEIVQYMCQESLIQYLKNHMPSKSNIEEFITRQQVSGFLEEKSNAIKLNDLLDEVKVCDPAIGSGAFPIGILQEIYKAKIHIYPYLKSSSAFNPAETKKKIIEESIHGVDLEHGAVEIARLRFWLALVVDETVPQPLPNLDYKIMQGNSLLERFEGVDLSQVGLQKNDLRFIEPERDLFGNIKDGQMKMTFTQTETTKQIQRLIRKYFNEKQPDQKDLAKKLINEKVHEIIDYNLELRETQISRLIAEAGNEANLKAKAKVKLIDLKDELNSFSQKKVQLHRIQNSKEKPYFIWHLFFKDVFDKGGFDIVIGNPPYIQLQKLGKLADILEEEKFDTFVRTGDIYCLFYEKGFKLLKPKGILSFITSNSWIRTKYGEALRRYIREKVNPLILLNFEDTRLFLTATVEANIIIVKNEPFSKNLEAAAILNDLNKNDLRKYFEETHIYIDELDDKGWIIADPDTYDIKKRIEFEIKRLNDKALNLEISRGIITGRNEAFVVSSNVREEIIQNDPNAIGVLRKFIGGRNLKKYTVTWNDEWILYMHSKVSEIDFPGITNYLRPFKSDLVKRRGGMNPKTGEVPYKWWQLQVDYYSSGTYKNYEKPKIMWAELSDKQKFVYDEHGFYPNKTIFIITGPNLKYLLALLNSKVAAWYFNQISTTSGMGTTIWSKYKVELLPIKEVDDILIFKFEIISSYLIFINSLSNVNIIQEKSNQEIFEDFENVLNLMVFEIYFENHVKELEIDILKHFYLTTIDQAHTLEERRQIIVKAWLALQERDNIIRNRVLISSSRSWIIKKINQNLDFS